MVEVRAIQGDTVDRICFRHYGYTAAVTEAVLESNHGLAEQGPIIAMGTRVRLPEVPAQPARQTVQLWD